MASITCPISPCNVLEGAYMLMKLWRHKIWPQSSNKHWCMEGSFYIGLYTVELISVSNC
jgi:hypothetical protein